MVEARQRHSKSGLPNVCGTHTGSWQVWTLRAIPAFVLNPFKPFPPWCMQWQGHARQQDPWDLWQHDCQVQHCLPQGLVRGAESTAQGSADSVGKGPLARTHLSDDTNQHLSHTNRTTCQLRHAIISIRPTVMIHLSCTSSELSVWCCIKIT